MKNMTARERFIATIKFEKTDRPFRWEAPAVWPATIKKWHSQGLPADITCNNISDSEIYSYYDMDKLVWLPIEGGWIGDPYYPFFEYKVLNDDGKHLVIQDTDGIIKKVLKEDPDTSMPAFLKFPVVSRKDYEDKIKWRLDYRASERFPNNWDEFVKNNSVRDFPIGMFVIGPFGHIRNLFGDENLMYTFYDDPDFVHEIMSDWMKFYIGFLTKTCADIVPDFIMIWEDMCYKSGPLISPDLYIEFMSPYLKQVISCAKSLGITGIVVDNDGDCSKMIPRYLECGANAFYPFEVQAGMDIVAIRKQYGDVFTIIGGLDKRTLVDSEADIRAELDKKLPFMLEQGGYIPMIDHSVPPNVTMDMFHYYIDYARKLGDN
jgi:hypothetical protein